MWAGGGQNTVDSRGIRAGRRRLRPDGNVGGQQEGDSGRAWITLK